MLKGFLLGLTMAARILLAWALGIAILWGLAISGMGGMEPATWMAAIVAAASAPVVLLALIVCLTFPALIYDKPLSFIFYAVAVPVVVTGFFGGLLGAVYAAFAAAPIVILFALSLVLLPPWRVRRWFA